MRSCSCILFVCLLGLLPSVSPAAESSPSRGKAFNPDISVGFLTLAQQGTGISDSRTAIPRKGVRLQEAELHFSADVDTYLRAVTVFALEQEGGNADYKFAPEEVYAETISLPVVTLKAGKFKVAVGRHNLMHTHAFPFIDAPLIHQQLLSDEGLNEKGVSAAVLLPFVPWFSEVTLQGFSLDNSALFAGRSSGDLGGLAHLKNLWDLSESTTMELGLSGLGGNNQFGKKTTVVGADLTLKWRPSSGGKYHSLVWSSEYLLGQRNGQTADRDVDDPANPGTNVTITESTRELGGLATWLQYQFAERWWLQGRYEYVGLPKSRTPSIADVSKQSALIGFLPSEFSGLRFQWDRIHDRARTRVDYAYSLQLNVSIGAHPAHAY